MILSNSGSKIILLSIAGFILLLRVCAVFFFPIMPQDAYYYLYSQHLDLSYFDHPPLIAYFLRIFTFVFGPTLFALRATAFCITSFTLAGFYMLSKKILSPGQAWPALLILFSTFLITDSSLLATPDVPLLFFWIFSLICIYNAIIEDRRSYWALSGLMMGLAFDSKYTAIFLWVGLILFLLLVKQYRKYLWSGHILLAILLFLVTISPVIIWNIQHDFASFRFQTGDRYRVASDINFRPSFLMGMLAHQAIFLIPVLLIFLFIYLAKTGRKFWRQPFTLAVNDCFLLCFFVPLFIFFLILSPFYWIKMNWVMPAYLSGIIWVSSYLTQKAIRWQIITSGVIHVLIAIEIIWYPFPVKSDDVWIGWKQLSNEVGKRKEEQKADFLFSADDYKTSAILNFYLPDKIFGKDVIGKPALEFDYIGTVLSNYEGKTAMYIDSDPHMDHDQNMQEVMEPLKKYFDSIIVQPPIRIYHLGQLQRQFSVLLCKHYHPPILKHQLSASAAQ